MRHSIHKLPIDNLGRKTTEGFDASNVGSSGLLSPHGTSLYITHFSYSKLEKLSANWPKIDNKTRMDECKTRIE